MSSFGLSWAAPTMEGVSWGEGGRLAYNGSSTSSDVSPGCTTGRVVVDALGESVRAAGGVEEDAFSSSTLAAARSGPGWPVAVVGCDPPPPTTPRRSEPARLRIVGLAWPDRVAPPRPVLVVGERENEGLNALSDSAVDERERDVVVVDELAVEEADDSSRVVKPVRDVNVLDRLGA